MGQKINPVSLRLKKTNKEYNSSWYSDIHYGTLLCQDLLLKSYFDSILKQIRYPEGLVSMISISKKIKILLVYLDPTESRRLKSIRFQLKVPKRVRNFQFSATSNNTFSPFFNTLQTQKDKSLFVKSTTKIFINGLKEISPLFLDKFKFKKTVQKSIKGVSFIPIKGNLLWDYLISKKENSKFLEENTKFEKWQRHFFIRYFLLFVFIQKNNLLFLKCLQPKVKDSLSITENDVSSISISNACALPYIEGVTLSVSASGNTKGTTYALTELSKTKANYSSSLAFSYTLQNIYKLHWFQKRNLTFLNYLDIAGKNTSLARKKSSLGTKNDAFALSSFVKTQAQTLSIKKGLKWDALSIKSKKQVKFKFMPIKEKNNYSTLPTKNRFIQTRFDYFFNQKNHFSTVSSKMPVLNIKKVDPIKSNYNKPIKSIFYMESVLSEVLKSNVTLYFWKTKDEKKSSLFLAEEIVYFLQRRVPFRRIKNQLLKELPWEGIKGVRIHCSGRVGGRSKKAQRARKESFQWGETSLNVFSSKLSFASKSALTIFGKVGVKVWICYQSR